MSLNTNSTRYGEYAELLFDHQAVMNKLVVSKPIISGSIYDRLVEYEGKIKRVQIKCITKLNRGNYVATLSRGNNVKYKSDEIDYFAVYVLPLSSWFFFEFKDCKYLNLSKFKRNNWDIFYE